ncbi:MAG: IPT/TIG domain-containing protein [Anaeromyxobacteraceae bacterium]
MSLKVLDSRAPPGGVAQLTVALTEPTPIVTARTKISYDPGTLGSVLGVALFSRANDVAGTAVVRDNQVTVRTTSPSAEFGTDADLPVLTVAIALRPDAPPGTQGTLALDPASSLWLGPAGQPYSQQVRNGILDISGTVSISDVLPTNGLLPAGSTVTVRGIGFQPGAVVEIDDVPVASTTFVSDTEVDATIAVAADVNGRKVKVKNPDDSIASSYAFLRTAWLAPTTRPLLATVEPIFSRQTFSSASFTNAAAAGQFLGLALQNPGDGSARVGVELHSTSGAGLIASTALTLPPRTRISREVSELFGGTAAPADGFLVVHSSVPVQMLGLIGDDAAGSVVPLLPAPASP